MAIRLGLPLAVFLFLGGASLASPPSPNTPSLDMARTYAFLVGLVQWQDRKLNTFPQKGRQDSVLAKELEARGVPRDHLVHLMDGEATHSRVAAELTRLAQAAEPGSTFLFYFTGHGSVEDDGQGYLFTYDVDGDFPEGTTLTPEEIDDILEQNFHGERVLLFGDFCHSEMLNEVARKLGSGGFQTAALTSADIDSESTADWTFTQSLVELLTGSRIADRNGDGRLTFREWADYLSDTMYYWEDQVPGAPLRVNMSDDFELSRVDPKLPLPARLGSFREGDYVEYRTENQHWGVAQVLKIESKKITIDRMDGTTVEEDVSKLRVPAYPQLFHIGEEVIVNISNHHYLARLKRVFRDYLFVTYLDSHDLQSAWVYIREVSSRPGT